ncbi:hypothetical protein [Marinobacter mangrovi]|uniref:hypothetical protein n=1 Tax=Marinobacter mangrovi TaxID=2803918 RepID=UPI0019335B7A|nr:hypothetical protein [Marinobacter mangrovi]
MAPIIDEFLMPVDEPDSNVEFQSGVIAWKPSLDGATIVQVLRRDSGTFGFGYLAWVAWRDAGDCIRSHSWHCVTPSIAAILVSEAEAKSYAEQHAATNGISLESEWRSVI